MSDEPSANQNIDERSASETSGCCGGSSPCCGSNQVNRRQFMISTTGAIAAAGAFAMRSSNNARAFAGPFTPEDTIDHFVPVDKKLDPQWMNSLFAPGEREWYQGAELNTIGMPIGGICAGQLYLTGDGRLEYWDLFNSDNNTGYGQVNYKVGRTPDEIVTNARSFVDAPAIAHGVAIRAQQNGTTATRTLDRRGFPNVRFCGEYPIGYLDFDDPAFPVEILVEAFSPFIPLNAEDSSLPVTILSYHLTNRSASDAVEISLAAWLENAVLFDSREHFIDAAMRRNRTIANDHLTGVMYIARTLPKPTKGNVRAPIVFADFEGGDYGEWKIDGKAFGAAPAVGTLANQQHVSGFKGKQLVNTYLGGNDQLQGRLTSPTFTIDRPWIGFLIGGGAHENKTCMNLVIDGNILRTATGRNNERLLPHNWDVSEFIGKAAHLEIVDAESGGWGHINVDQIEFRDEPMLADFGELRDQRDFGTMCLAIVNGEDEDGGGEAISTAHIDDGSGAQAIFDQLSQPAVQTAETLPDNSLIGATARTITLKPGERRTIRVILAWHMPNRYRGEKRVGNNYATRFMSAQSVAEYVARHINRLTEDTRAWHDAFYQSTTLPKWLLVRLHSTVSNLATSTCQWWGNGRFWAWEGVGCCHGTCGHVWNYEHALARLFPSLERSVRELQDFAPGVGLNPETGAIGFRGENYNYFWAGDAQAGYILKAYREHLCSSDDAFLERNWKHIRLALEFLITEDSNDDGLLEGRQHNTYDIDYYGPNTMVGSLYLAALRAGEEMARRIRDRDFADRCRAIFERGRDKSVEQLFNGEYFEQKVDLAEHPDWQYASGCLSDHQFGQGWAHQIGLGYIYPRDTVRSSLESIWKYNWAPDVAPQNEHHKPERWFAYPGEAGLFTCTWPRSEHLGPRSTRYRNEIWTGIEYQVAGHMIWEGMIKEGLAICRAVHDRYHPSKHNPWNEIECGDHYARALASHGVYLALCGFEYDGPAGHLGFAPRMNEDDFCAAFTAAEGWGTVRQLRTHQKQEQAINVRYGRVWLRSIAFELADGRMASSAVVTLGKQSVASDLQQEGKRVLINLREPIVIPRDQTLNVVLELT